METSSAVQCTIFLWHWGRYSDGAAARRTRYCTLLRMSIAMPCGARGWQRYNTSPSAPGGVGPERDRDGGETRRDTHPHRWCEVSPRGSLLLTVSGQTSRQEDSVVRTDGDVANRSPFGHHDDHGTPADHAGPVDHCPLLSDSHQRDSSELGSAPGVLLLGSRRSRPCAPPFAAVSKPYPRRPREPKQWSCDS